MKERDSQDPFSDMWNGSPRSGERRGKNLPVTPEEQLLLSEIINYLEEGNANAIIANIFPKQFRSKN